MPKKTHLTYPSLRGICIEKSKSLHNVEFQLHLKIQYLINYHVNINPQTYKPLNCSIGSDGLCTLEVIMYTFQDLGLLTIREEDLDIQVELVI
jgi:hypothetical protein